MPRPLRLVSMRTLVLSEALAARIVFAALMQLPAGYIMAGDDGAQQVDKPLCGVWTLAAGARVASILITRPFLNSRPFLGTDSGYGGLRSTTTETL